MNRDAQAGLVDSRDRPLPVAYEHGLLLNNVAKVLCIAKVGKRPRILREAVDT